MSRQIKFRFWDLGINDFCYSDEYRSGRLDLFFERFHLFGREESLEEWTGLIDSEGKDIYEGDIVKWDDASDGKYWRVAQVVWNEKGGWTFRTIPSRCIGSCTEYERDFNMTSFIYSPNPSVCGNVLEIIGNIHQNPELLV